MSIKLSKRVSSLTESVTLKLNAQAVKMAVEGKKVYNLTAGQLPFRPPRNLVEGIRGELDFLGSFQYSPVAGEANLRETFLNYFYDSRKIKSTTFKEDFSLIIGNGGKHVVSNVFASLIDEGDEVVLIAPYWVSYPEMVNIYGGKINVVSTSIFNAFEPSLDDIREAITDKTKMIVINSPNNPTGTHYSDEWMKGFASFLKDYPNLMIMSDEIYYELNYFDPRPTYFYQHDEELLKRTIIIDGISKNLASTGLRIGYCIADKELISSMTKLQGHTASGANSLIQKSLLKYDFDKISEYLDPVKSHLRDNSQILKDCFRERNLSKCWYQTISAFYYFIDFSQTDLMSKYQKSEDDGQDYSAQICADLLEQKGLALVPGIAFGSPNCARLSLVPPKDSFKEAMELLAMSLTGE